MGTRTGKQVVQRGGRSWVRVVRDEGEERGRVRRGLWAALDEACSRNGGEGAGGAGRASGQERAHDGTETREDDVSEMTCALVSSRLTRQRWNWQ